MQRLLLFRHGKTEAMSHSGRDFDRALTARGKQNSTAMAEVIAETAGVPRLVLVSPALRAMQTWEQVAAAWQEAKPHVISDERIYGASVETLCQVVKTGGEAYMHADTGEAEVDMSVMLVGHNPGLMHLAQWLIGDRGDAIAHLPTAGVVDIEVPANKGEVLDLVAMQSKGKLLHFHRP